MAVVTKADQITTGAGIKAGGKKKEDSVCVATQKGTLANPPLIGPLYIRVDSAVLLFPFPPLSLLSALVTRFLVFSFFFLVRHFVRFPDCSSSSVRINVLPMNPLINLANRYYRYRPFEGS